MRYNEKVATDKLPYFWDEESYLDKNTDVANGVDAGTLKSGWAHYCKYGRREGRDSFFLEKEYWATHARSLAKIKPHISVNYVIACWSGERRDENTKYHQNREYYIKEHLKSLHRVKHNLSQITVIVAENEEEPEEFADFIKSIPNKIRDTKVVVLRRENEGQSYGSYSHVYGIYRDTFSHYILIEDDYLFDKDDFDSELVGHLAMRDKCGFLCSLVLPTPPDSPPHAAISNGIASSEILEKIWKRFGKLPHLSSENNDGYSTWPQLVFSWAFLEVGTELEDLINLYRAPFNHAGELRFYGDEGLENLIIPIQFLESLVMPEKLATLK